MKLLFVILLLANIFVALWEYRYGRSHAGRQSSEIMQENLPGLDKIWLAHETVAIPAGNEPRGRQPISPDSLPAKNLPVYRRGTSTNR